MHQRCTLYTFKTDLDRGLLFRAWNCFFGGSKRDGIELPPSLVSALQNEEISAPPKTSATIVNPVPGNLHHPSSHVDSFLHRFDNR